MPTAAIVLGVLLWAAAATQSPPPAYIPPAPEQPLPYSHKQHLALGGLDCATCHTMPEPGDAATLPSTSVCMTCHTRMKTDSPSIQQLASAHASGEAIEWKRVYRVASFVSFSHKPHVKGRDPAACETCHGAVRDMDVMQRVKDVSMASCLQCHEEKQAPTRCDACHDPR
jgi:hypothetical protein